MKIRVSLLIVALLVATGCRKTSTSSTTPPTTQPSPVAQLDNSQGGSAPAIETKHFKGSIGTSLDLQMKLVRTGDQLAGSYSYQKVGTRIDLRGTVDKAGNLSLDEFDTGGKQTGVFKGLWTTDPKDGLITLAGNWSKPPDQKDSDKKTAFSLHEEPISFTGDVDLVAKQIKENNKKLNFEISAQYPQLTGGNNPNTEKFNQLARGVITRKVAMFKKEMAPEEGENTEETRPEDSMGSDLTVTYLVALAQDDLVSVNFTVSTYYQGAAHPNHYAETLNYDLKNGKVLRLSDLFKPGAKYLQAMATYSIADLKKQAEQNSLMAEEIEKGAAAKSENYGAWTVTRGGIGVEFDPYQVGPYAAGPQYVTVPYSTLKDLINPDGPVALFAK
ncbi:MAG TPA: RsiV family protein [Pyrinomonadaceae bacterium]|nr:RsiV family protein [Pyrinomonadaceae bacterium]